MKERFDPFILPYVKLLNNHGIHTDWSCEGHHKKEKYASGFPKSDHAIISGKLKRLSDLGKITKLLVGRGCFCRTCCNFTIHARLVADACGVHKPTTYYYSVHFKGPITMDTLIADVIVNKKLAVILDVVKPLHDIIEKSRRAARLKYRKERAECLCRGCVAVKGSLKRKKS